MYVSYLLNIIKTRCTRFFTIIKYYELIMITTILGSSSLVIYISSWIWKLICLLYIICIIITIQLYHKFNNDDIPKNTHNNTFDINKYIVYRSKKKDIIDNIIFVGQWQGRRNYMEDMYIVNGKYGIYGVIDGHGGKDTAEYITNNFISVYRKLTITTKNITSLLNNTINKLEKLICDNDILGGAVGIFIKITKHGIYCTNVGDSMAYVVSGNGGIYSMNDVHTLTNYGEFRRYVNISDVRSGTVMRTKTGLIPTRTIGDNIHKRLDQGLLSIPDITLYSGEWSMIIVGSDGIWDCLDPHDVHNNISIMIKNNNHNIDGLYGDITKYMGKLSKYTSKHSNMIDKIYNRVFGDNCTLMIIINYNNM